MPRDSQGNFHLNTQRALGADKARKLTAPGAPQPGGPVHAPKPAAPPKPGGSRPGEINTESREDRQAESAAHTTLHDHGDGTFHSEGHDGEQVEHPHIGHALMHMAQKHAPGIKHMHVQHDGVEHVSHHVGEDGEVQGPHSHENMEALKQHMDQFLNEEENESGSGY